MKFDRRQFVKTGSSLALGAFLPTLSSAGKSGGVEASEKDLFTVSLSQWSYHKAIFGDTFSRYAWWEKMIHSDPDAVLAGGMDPRDIVVLVNVLWLGHGWDSPWIAEFKRRAEGEGVGFGVLMCDQIANMAASDKGTRKRSIDEHIRWMDTAVELGCPYLRVNAYGDGSYLELCRNGADSLHQLGEAAESRGLQVLVENHGHPSSNAAWLAMMLEMAAHPRVGAFTDFDNFFMGGWGHEPQRRYDTLQGMLDLAPFTRAVSAKSYDFDADGNETKVDFELCLRTALQGGFRSLASAEYEGHRHTEQEGSRLTVELLRRIRSKLFEEMNA